MYVMCRGTERYAGGGWAHEWDAEDIWRVWSRVWRTVVRRRTSLQGVSLEPKVMTNVIYLFKMKSYIKVHKQKFKKYKKTTKIQVQAYNTIQYNKTIIQLLV